MGHCNYGDLRKLEGVVEGMRVTNYEEIECMLCTEGKMCQIRNKSPDERAKALLGFVHCNLAGPIDPTGRDGLKYPLSFVDDFSGIVMVYSSPPLTRTPKGNEKLFELAGVRVNRSWCQISYKFYSK